MAMMNRKLEDLDDSSDEDDTSSDDEPQQMPRVGSTAAAALADDGDSSDSSDEDDVEMEVDEDALQLELKAVVDKLLREPYSYDLYLEKIRILKALGDLDGLRNAREKMSELYPLSPTLWIDWLKDEQKLITDDEEKERVITLMDRAVKDYSSVEVWLEYINFCLGRVGEENGEQRCRDVIEKALANCGLNVSMGSLIWDTYRDFEAALLATKVTEDEQVEQEKRYINLCKRQLSVPLLGMKTSYKHIKTKIEIDKHTEAAYNKAVQRLKDLETWEAKLVQSADDYQKIQAYKDYIEDEKKIKSNPARVQCLYERALTELPLELTLWNEYIDYLSKHLKIPDLILSVSERASRNCPWIITIWTKYMWAVETFLEDEEEVLEKIKTVFEKAVIYCGTAEQAGTLWLKYLEFLRRAVKDYDSPNPKPLEILRKTFTAAEQHLLQLVEEPNDYISQILQFKARFEAHLAKSNTQEVRTIWKNIFQRGYGQNFRVWVQYISQEIKYGSDVKNIRSELTRAMSYVRDDPNSIADIWLNFERDHGDLATMISCETKISKELAKTQAVSEDSSAGQYYQNYQKDAQFVKDPKENRAQARKRKFEESTGAAVAPKKGRPTSVNIINNNNKMDVVDGGFKMPAIPSMPKEELEKKPVVKTEPVKHDHSKDHRAVFVSNLDFNTNEDGIKGFFADCGAVEDVRLVRDFKGRSKGFGYVFFESEDSVKLALAKDRDPLDNRPTFVSKCDPDKSTRQAQFKYPTALEKNKIFVKGLPFTKTVDELQVMFGAFGNVKDCRLVTHRNGHSKGLAYVEFEKEANASAAILKTDGMKIGEHVISVSISNPPSKNAAKTTKFPPTRAEPDQRRSRNMFVPRVVQVQPIVSAKSGTGGSSSTKPAEELPASGVSTATAKATASKSNDDFRKLFMKQT